MPLGEIRWDGRDHWSRDLAPWDKGGVEPGVSPFERAGEYVFVPPTKGKDRAPCREAGSATSVVRIGRQEQS